MWIAKEALKGRRIAHRKTWVSFFVQKPNHKCDAINVVDTVCDALKKVMGLDDRWFSIGQVDWEIVREQGRIYIRVAQESDEDTLSCSHCGRVLTLDNFHKNRSGPLGRGRVCLDCTRVLNEHRKKARVNI